MAFDQQKREALHLLEGIENGTLGTSALGGLIDDADPALVYFIVTWLRSRYGGDHPAAEGVIGRLVELMSRASMNAKMREGKADSLVEWFEDDYDYKDYPKSDFIDLIVEKLEG